ncbi:MAG: zinc ABC transporter substrate-binding protein [Alphaproteobacteria bacterium]|nr:zinc ABC transporter substrate-binding protein [Alphaproteobacteria bacterium]
MNPCRHRHARLWPALFGLASALACAAPAGAAPRVVASIAPIHSLTAEVMRGLGEPRLLLPVGASPHTYQMRPSDAEALSGADLVVWVGPGLERFLDKPLRALAGRGDRLTLSETSGLRLLPARPPGPFEAAHEDDGHGPSDPHIWLDAANAALLARALADRLAALDPENGPAYRANADRLATALAALDGELKARLAGLAHRPIVVFHDAYRYFEEAYDLNVVAAVTVSPSRLPSAHRLEELRGLIARSGAVCLFVEPQFEPRFVAILADGLPVRTGTLDPLGTDHVPGPELYGELMRDIARNLASCLG